MTTTLYRLYDAEDRLLYVGISAHPWQRFTQHSANKGWWTAVASVRLEPFSTRPVAEEAERQAILHEQPLHNGSSRSLAARAVAAGPPLLATSEDALADLRGWMRMGAERRQKLETSIVAAYTAGASIAAIADATTLDGNGVGQYTYEGVRKLLIRHRVELRPRGRPAGE